MPTENIDEISHFIVQSSLEKDKQFLIGALKEILGLFKEINSLEINLKPGTNYKEATKAMKEYGDGIEKVKKQEKEMLESTDKLTEATIKKARADEAIAKANRAKIAEENEVIKQILLEDKASQQLLKTRELLAKQDQGSKAKEPDAPANNAEVPFTNNLAELEAERNALNQTGAAVSDYTLKQREAQIAAAEWYASQSDQTEKIKEQVQQLEQLSLKYDEFSGSLQSNLEVQTSNNILLKQNKEEQSKIEKEISNSGSATDAQIRKLAELRVESTQLVEENINL
jgi:DNA repair exonuclease SbcCD ATPase subunit